MPYFKWDEADLALKIPQIDRQHRSLIDTMNRIFDLNEGKAERAEIEQTIMLLRYLMTEHFRDEEAYMASIKFPRLDIHKTIHKQLRLRLEDYIEIYRQGDGVVSREFFQFLQVWLTSHIMGVDKEFSLAQPLSETAGARYRRI